MTPAERKRAGAAVAARIKDLNSTVPEIAAKAGVDPTTIRALIRGKRWPRKHTRDCLNDALEWPEGEIRRIALGDGSLVDLSEVPSIDMLHELTDRCERLYRTGI